MRKALGVVVVACAAALMGAQFNQVQIQLIVGGDGFCRAAVQQSQAGREWPTACEH